MRTPWTNKQCEKLCQHYQDETANLDFDALTVARWAEKRGYDMPIPPTGVELLAQRLQGAVLTARRKDRKTSILYRAMLAVPKMVKGKLKKVWFDADGPAATYEKVMESYHRRKDYALNVLTLAAATVEHWFQDHPNPQRPQLDLGISDQEVRWRLLGPNGGQEGQEKIG